MKRISISPVALFGGIALLMTLVWLSWLVYSFSSSSAAYGIFGDEGIFLTGADHILQGEMPNRDFITYLSPAAYYPLAAFFSLFGSGYVVARTFLLINIFGIIAALYWLAWPLLRWWGFLPVATFAFVIFPAWPYVSHHWLFLLFALLSTRCLLYRTARWQVAGGILAGISFAVFPEKGIFVLVAHMVILVLYGIRNLRSLAATLLTYLGGFLIPLAAGVGWLIGKGIWHSFLQQAFVDAVSYYPQQVSPLVFFTFNNNAVLMILGFIGLGLVLILSRHLTSFSRQSFVAIYVLHIFLSLSVWYHLELYHILQIIAPSIILAFASGVIFIQNRKAILQKFSYIDLVALVCVTIVISLSVPFVLAYQSSYGAGMGAPSHFSTFSTSRGNVLLNNFRTPRLIEEYTATSQLVAATLSGKHIFFLPYAPGFYYFFNLRNVTSFDFMVTDIMPSAYVRQLEEEFKNVDAVVLLPASWGSFDTQGTVMRMVRERFVYKQELLQGRVQVFSRNPI